MDTNFHTIFKFLLTGEILISLAQSDRYAAVFKAGYRKTVRTRVANWNGIHSLQSCRAEQNSSVLYVVRCRTEADEMRSLFGFQLCLQLSIGLLQNSLPKSVSLRCTAMQSTLPSVNLRLATKTDMQLISWRLGQRQQQRNKSCKLP